MIYSITFLINHRAPIQSIIHISIYVLNFVPDYPVGSENRKGLNDTNNRRFVHSHLLQKKSAKHCHWNLEFYNNALHHVQCRQGHG